VLGLINGNNQMNNYIFSESVGDLGITFLASILIWIMLGGVIALWVFGGKKQKEIAISAFFAGLLAWLSSELIKSLIPATRPFQINGFPPLTITIPNSHSFPSSHTAFAFGISVWVFLKNKKLGLIYLVSALLVGWGRILDNVHFFVDILGGAILGTVGTIILSMLNFSIGLKPKNQKKNSS
jgi:undecaprenyl-diphosphatase